MKHKEAIVEEVIVHIVGDRHMINIILIDLVEKQ